MNVVATPALSVIVPYYKKIADLRAVLPHDARFLDRPDVELVLVLDEPSEEAEVLALLDRLPRIRARVIVNDQPHEWRPPCVAVNVGLRHAVGRYVLVKSPESAFVGDGPSRVLASLSERPNDVLLGRVAFATYQAARHQRLAVLFEQSLRNLSARGFAAAYYGSIAAARELFAGIGGYDETLRGWGGDDDNVRARLAMAGAKLVLDRDLRLLHLSQGPRDGARPTSVARNERAPWMLSNPTSATANAGNWGTAFKRIARDWRDDRPA